MGLSSTGVFVSKVMTGGVEGVQVGDQILAVNGQSTGRYQKIVSLTEGVALIEAQLKTADLKYVNRQP